MGVRCSAEWGCRGSKQVYVCLCVVFWSLRMRVLFAQVLAWAHGFYVFHFLEHKHDTLPLPLLHRYPCFQCLLPPGTSFQDFSGMYQHWIGEVRFCCKSETAVFFFFAAFLFEWNLVESFFFKKRQKFQPFSKRRLFLPQESLGIYIYICIYTHPRSPKTILGATQVKEVPGLGSPSQTV